MRSHWLSVLTLLFGRTQRVDWRLAHAEDWVTYGTCRLRYLWVQQRVHEGDLRLKKEPGDSMTNLLIAMSYEFRFGRTSLALVAR